MRTITGPFSVDDSVQSAFVLWKPDPRAARGYSLSFTAQFTESQRSLNSMFCDSRRGEVFGSLQPRHSCGNRRCGMSKYVGRLYEHRLPPAYLFAARFPENRRIAR